MKRLWFLLVVLPYLGMAQSKERAPAVEFEQQDVEALFSKTLNAYLEKSRALNRAVTSSPSLNQVYLLNSLDRTPIDYDYMPGNRIVEIVPTNYDENEDDLELNLQNIQLNSSFGLRLTNDCPTYAGYKTMGELEEGIKDRCNRRFAACVSFSKPFYDKTNPSVFYISLFSSQGSGEHFTGTFKIDTAGNIKLVHFDRWIIEHRVNLIDLSKPSANAKSLPLDSVPSSTVHRTPRFNLINIDSVQPGPIKDYIKNIDRLPTKSLDSLKYNR